VLVKERVDTNEETWLGTILSAIKHVDLLTGAILSLSGQRKVNLVPGVTNHEGTLTIERQWWLCRTPVLNIA